MIWVKRRLLDVFCGIGSVKCDLVCFHETKLEKVSLVDSHSLWDCRLSNFVFLKYRGLAGSILTM